MKLLKNVSCVTRLQSSRHYIHQSLQSVIAYSAQYAILLKLVERIQQTLIRYALHYPLIKERSKDFKKIPQRITGHQVALYSLFV